MDLSSFFLAAMESRPWRTVLIAIVAPILGAGAAWLFVYGLAVLASHL